MTEDRKDGGPAFPTERFTSYGNGAGVMTREGGMTLRDWFAGQAMLAAGGNHCSCYDRADAAYRAYCMADAMLAAREVKP